MAARNGHLEVIRDLQPHGIHCTSFEADVTAAYGCPEVVHDLREHGVRCAWRGANWVAQYGQPEVVQDLRTHGRYFTSEAADSAATNGHLCIVQDLRAHGIYCTAKCLRMTIAHRNLDVVEDLHAETNNICSAALHNAIFVFARLKILFLTTQNCSTVTRVTFETKECSRNLPRILLLCSTSWRGFDGMRCI